MATPDELKIIISKNLNSLIEQRGITQLLLAESIGVSKPTMSRFAHAAQMPSSVDMYALANYFNVSIDWLYGRTETPFLNDGKSVKATVASATSAKQIAIDPTLNDALRKLIICYQRSATLDRQAIDLILSKYEWGDFTEE